MRLFEVLTSGASHASVARGMLHYASAADFVCGAVELEELEGGWIRPHRFGRAQRRALQSCLAWHPGLYRQMARATSGVCLRFATDATEVALAVRLDEEPRGTTAVVSKLDSGRRRPHDGISVMVDGKPFGCALPQALSRPLPWMDDAEGQAIFSTSLEDHGNKRAMTMSIPGLGKRHEVCLWLPNLRGCAVREIWSDGTYFEPLPSRRRMLVLGDSIGQGFCADDPLLSWPALLAEHLSLELINQSVGGQVFQPSSLMGAVVDEAELVIVELGGNYRHEPCARSAVQQDIRAFLREVSRAYEDVRCVVVTPTGHNSSLSPVHTGSCVREVSRMLQRTGREMGMEVVDGLLLMDNEDAVLADGEHPSTVGHVQIASRLAAALQ